MPSPHPELEQNMKALPLVEQGGPVIDKAMASHIEVLMANPLRHNLKQHTTAVTEEVWEQLEQDQDHARVSRLQLRGIIARAILIGAAQTALSLAIPLEASRRIEEAVQNTTDDPYEY